MRKEYRKKYLKTNAKEKKANAFRNIFIYFPITMVLLCIVLLYVWQKVKINTLGFEIASLEKQEKELVQQNELLKLKYEELSSLDRIERIAIKKMKMQIPEKVEIIYMSN